MENLHNSVMINEIISFLPLKKSVNVIDATFGGGGYSKTILEKFNVNQLLAIDRDPISKIFAKEIESKFSNFTLCLGKKFVSNKFIFTIFIKSVITLSIVGLSSGLSVSKFSFISLKSFLLIIVISSLSSLRRNFP